MGASSLLFDGVGKELTVCLYHERSTTFVETRDLQPVTSYRWSTRLPRVRGDGGLSSAR